MNLVLVFTTLFASAEASSQNHSRQIWEPLLLNPCTGELIQFKAVMNFVSRTGVDANGGRHLTIQNNVVGRGVSNLGGKYVFVRQTNFQRQDIDPQNFSVSLQLRIKLVGQGPSNNHFITTKALLQHHNGVTQVNYFDSKIECQ